MAWLYSRSSTWRRIVNTTQKSSLYMATFAVAAVGIPMYLGDTIMNKTTNSTSRDAQLQDTLRSKQSLDAQVLANAQKQRLQVLLDEVKNRSDGARYTAALNGESLGTHSSGSTSKAVAINSKQ